MVNKSYRKFLFDWASKADLIIPENIVIKFSQICPFNTVHVLIIIFILIT